MSQDSDTIQIAVLGQKLEYLKNGLEDFKVGLVKIDEAIEKMSLVNSNIEKMLVIHTERINNQDQKIDDQEKFDKSLYNKIEKLNDRVEALQRKQIFVLGVVVMLIFTINNQNFFKTLLTGHETPAIIEPAPKK